MYAILLSWHPVATAVWGPSIITGLKPSDFVRHIFTNKTRSRIVCRCQIIKCLLTSNLLGHEAQAQSRTSPQSICGGQSGTGICFCQSISVFPTSVLFLHCSMFIFHLSATGTVSFLQLTVYLPPALCHSYNWQFYQWNTVLGESGILVVYVLRNIKGWARSRRTPVPMKARRPDGSGDSGEDTSVLERSQRTERVVTKAGASGHFIE